MVTDGDEGTLQSEDREEIRTETGAESNSDFEFSSCLYADFLFDSRKYFLLLRKQRFQARLKFLARYVSFIGILYHFIANETYFRRKVQSQFLYGRISQWQGMTV